MKYFYPQYKFKLLRDVSPNRDPQNYNPVDFATRLQGLAPRLEREGNLNHDITQEDQLNVFSAANTEARIFAGGGFHIFVDEDTEKIIHNAISKLEPKALAKFRPKTPLGLCTELGKTLFCSGSLRINLKKR